MPRRKVELQIMYRIGALAFDVGTPMPVVVVVVVVVESYFCSSPFGWAPSATLVRALGLLTSCGCMLGPADESLTCNVCDRAFRCRRQLASHQQKKRHFGLNTSIRSTFA
uniref:C2H2-type domain-containing protein n=1 Tax=Anopheles epiroticus TaxID=199890 RepID=A0A182PL31_9DIPT